jgi:hypothetical protein
MIKKYYDKKTGRIHNLLLRSHEEIMTNDDQLIGKNLTVYGESKMIEVKKSYVLELTEQQAKELYQILDYERKQYNLGVDKELVLVYHELKKIFGSGIR